MMIAQQVMILLRMENFRLSRLFRKKEDIFSTTNAPPIPIIIVVGGRNSNQWRMPSKSMALGTDTLSIGMIAQNANSTYRGQRCWLFLKNMAHNGALKMFISCTESSHQIARTPVRQTPPV